MKKTLFNYSVLLCTLLAPNIVFAYGEGADITYGARAMHMLINDARTNPKDALKNCPKANCKEGLDCYPTSSHAVYWRTDLRYAAELQAKLLAEADAGLYSHCSQWLLI